MDSFKEFYNSTKKGFYQYILSKINDSDTANDIVQESYLKLYTHYNDRYTVQLLYTIGKNLVIDEYNRKKDHLDTSEVELSYNEDKTAELDLERVLSHLDDEEKQLFFMSVVDGLKYEEISQMTGLSVANIKIKIYRARKKIKEILAGGGL